MRLLSKAKKMPLPITAVVCVHCYEEPVCPQASEAGFVKVNSADLFQ